MPCDPRGALPLLLLLAAGCGSAPTATQEPGPGRATSQPARDPQSTIEPRSAPGRGQVFLAQMVGDWTVHKTFHPRSGPAAESSGECKQTMIHDGRFLRSEFVFTGETGRSTGTGIIGFEADTGLFTSFWTDSRSTRMSIRQSQEPFSGDQIVLHGRSLGTTEGRRSRTLTRMEGPDRIVHQQFGMAQDGSERLVMELVLTRRK